MPLSEPITPGVVDWTGENPGILLKNDDGSFSAMALFFRVAWSPVGQGQVLLLYGTPGAEQGTAEAPNIIISDNAGMSDYLLENFIGKLAAFRDAPAFKGLTQLVAQSIQTVGGALCHLTELGLGRTGHQRQVLLSAIDSLQSLQDDGSCQLKFCK